MKKQFAFIHKIFICISMKKRFTLILTVCICISMFGCSNGKEPSQTKSEETTVKAESRAELKDCPVMRDDKFGGVYVKISIDDFNQLGFAYGDSVDVAFSNGYTIDDIPYYNGYYVEAGELLVVGYPGYEYMKVCINYGDDLYQIANLTDKDTATITLAEKEKYLKTQNAMNITYSDERDDYESDVIFANFRNFACGKMKKNVFYRSASPCDNQHNRASYTDSLIKKAGVNFIMNLSDSDEDIKEHIDTSDFNSPYFLSLYKKGNVIALSMNADYKGDEFKTKVAEGFTAMTKNNGPYLIHCVEGKDRTGFVCMLVEALAGATYQEIIDDYMITYDNYYGINRESDEEKYEAIKNLHINTMLKYISGASDNDDLFQIDFQEGAKKYLLNAGMKEKDLEKFIEILIKK